MRFAHPKQNERNEFIKIHTSGCVGLIGKKAVLVLPKLNQLSGTDRYLSSFSVELTSLLNVEIGIYELKR